MMCELQWQAEKPCFPSIHRFSYSVGFSLSYNTQTIQWKKTYPACGPKLILHEGWVLSQRLSFFWMEKYTLCFQFTNRFELDCQTPITPPFVRKPNPCASVICMP